MGNRAKQSQCPHQTSAEAMAELTSPESWPTVINPASPIVPSPKRQKLVLTAERFCSYIQCYVASIGAASSYIAFVGCLVERLAPMACCTRVAPSSLQHQKSVGESLAVLYSSKTIEQMEGMCQGTSLQAQVNATPQPHTQLTQFCTPKCLEFGPFIRPNPRDHVQRVT